MAGLGWASPVALCSRVQCASANVTGQLWRAAGLSRQPPPSSSTGTRSLNKGVCSGEDRASGLHLLRDGVSTLISPL